MTKTQRNFLSTLFASLPLLHYGMSFHTAFFVAAWVALVFWVTSLFFKATYHFFPKPLRQFSYMFWLACWIPLGKNLMGFPGIWVLSVFLLQPLSEWARPRKPVKRKSRKGSFWNAKLLNSLFWRGLGFWMLMAGIGICGEIFVVALQLNVFSHPAGMFLILGVITYLWQQGENGVRA